MVHWRREWQTTSVFLPWEPHEQYKKAKRMETHLWKYWGYTRKCGLEQSRNHCSLPADWRAEASGSQRQEGWLQIQGWSSRGRKGPAAPPKGWLGHREQLLYPEYLLPADSAGRGLAQFISSLSLQFSIVYKQILSEFLSWSPWEKEFGWGHLFVPNHHYSWWSMGGLASLETRVSTLVLGSLISKQTRFLVME